MISAKFEWDEQKDTENLIKHHVSFQEAQAAFADPHRVIARDISHSETEKRFYWFWQGGRWRSHGAVHLSTKGYSAHWSWLLAQRKGCL